MEQVFEQLIPAPIEINGSAENRLRTLDVGNSHEFIPAGFDKEFDQLRKWLPGTFYSRRNAWKMTFL